jgi:hypothetical protein
LEQYKTYRSRNYSKSEREGQEGTKREKCWKCHRFGHPGPWDSSCPHHIPNYRGKNSLDDVDQKTKYQKYRKSKNKVQNSQSEVKKDPLQDKRADIKCFWCGGYGHVKLECPTKRLGLPQVQPEQKY